MPLPMAVGSISLNNIGIHDIRRGLYERLFTVESLVETYITRIRDVNPSIHAVSQINPDAVAIARQRDNEIATERDTGLLHGIPILVKDMFLTRDGMVSTNGCSGLLKAVPKFEATAIRRLREEGAVLLGKTVPTEWANYRSPNRIPGGWSPVGGQCLAPYHDNQDPSGSSSGSAVAVALGLAAAALGTETSGSLSSPAQKAGVISIKPTVGLTSRYGVYSVSEWQDTVGVLSRTVLDGATVLSAISGPDENDPFTCGLRGKRIAIPRHLFTRVDETGNRLFNEALDVVRAQGAIIVENVEFEQFNGNFTFSKDPKWTLGLHVSIRENMKKSLADYETNPEDLHTLADVIEYTKRTPAEQADKWGVDEWETCEQMGIKYGPDSREFMDSLEWRHRMGREIQQTLDRAKCDMFFVPTAVDTGANVGGCPTVGVPIGFYPQDTPVKTRPGSSLVVVGPNIPIAAMFVGRRWDDYNLIGAAYAYEQASQIRAKGQLLIKSDIELANYLTPLEKWDEVKPYEIRGRIPPGLDRNNFDFTPYEVNIEDARSSTSEKTPCHVDGLNDSHSMLDKAGFTWVFNPLTDSLDSDANVDQHLASMKEFIVDYFKADLVSIFQYQIRKTLPDYKDPRVRPPSTFVHVVWSRGLDPPKLPCKCGKDSEYRSIQDGESVAPYVYAFGGPSSRCL
ncbi:hypothetical protein SBRCBS47491_007503 [Sporothrix bragantina]|uniref:Amidase domain-containing protein n=1 Tax=Sporothrix bragantina TaxID=671064 RepID=A0ABP0CGF5_9PEZI